MALPFASQVEAITHAHIIPVVADNIFNKYPVLKRFKSKAKLVSGGTNIQVPVYSAAFSSSDAEYFDGFDSHNITPTDPINAGQLNWKQVVAKIHVSRKQILQNGTPEGVLQLVAERTRYAEKAASDLLSQGLYSDGTASTGASTTKQLTGLRAVLSNSSTYAGIAVADMSQWIAQVSANSGTARALSLPLMNTTYQNSSDGNERPSILICGRAVYNEYYALAQPFERNIPAEIRGSVGFEDADAVFNGKPIFVDPSIGETDSFYFINEEFCYLVIHRLENGRVVSHENLEEQGSMLKKMYWMLNLVSNNRRRQGKLDDIQTS